MPDIFGETGILSAILFGIKVNFSHVSILSKARQLEGTDYFWKSFKSFVVVCLAKQLGEEGVWGSSGCL